MNKIHVLHYQKDVVNHAFITSLLASDTAICVHHLHTLSFIKESLGYPLHCIIYECDVLTKDHMKEVQGCIKQNIPVLFLIYESHSDIKQAQIPGTLLYKPRQNHLFSSFTNQLLVNIRCIHTVQRSPDNHEFIDTNSHELIAIGASTGGPKALGTILKKLPERMCGIVIVQHMIDANTVSFASYLDQMCKMHVKVAEQNEPIKNGVIYIARQKQHLVVKKAYDSLYLQYQEGEKVNCVCPSIDVLFQSLTNLRDPRISGVLLTGMGIDGAHGLKAMKEAGLFTIIQNKESCELYGMPKEAKRIHAYHRELPLEQISDCLIHHYASLHQKKEKTS